MASDKDLLTIMKQQGLGCYVDIMGLQRGARVGLRSAIAKLVMHAVTKSGGTIKFYCGKWQYGSPANCMAACWQLKQQVQ